MISDLSKVRANSEVLVLLSGGIDSTVCLWKCMESGLDVSVVTFDYPNRPKGEKEATEKVLEHSGIESYSTEVPIANRQEMDYPIQHNHILSHAIAADLARQIGADYIVGGQIKDDWTKEGAVDATPLFADKLSDLISMSYQDPPELVQPLLYKTKSEVVEQGLSIGAPIESTWSCLHGGNSPCGDCFQCKSRKQVLQLHDVQV